MPGAVRRSPANCPAFGYGKGFRSTASRTLKTTVLAPTAAAKVTRVMAANIGARVNLRETCRSWFVRELMNSALLLWSCELPASNCSYDENGREVPGKNRMEASQRRNSSIRWPGAPRIQVCYDFVPPFRRPSQAKGEAHHEAEIPGWDARGAVSVCRSCSSVRSGSDTGGEGPRAAIPGNNKEKCFGGHERPLGCAVELQAD